MTKIEKMELFIRVMKGEAKIEYNDPKHGWLGLTYDKKFCNLMIDGRECHSWNFSSLLFYDYEIRIENPKEERIFGVKVSRIMEVVSNLKKEASINDESDLIWQIIEDLVTQRLQELRKIKG